MNKKQKEHQSVIPGHSIGASVVQGDLGFAIRAWKKKLKDSDILNKIKSKKEFIKPSVANKNEFNQAVYRQKMESLKDF
jgi:ribosomal protein S21